MRSLVLAGCVMAAALSPARAAGVEANKELYRHYIEDLWNKKDPTAPDRYLAPDYVEHNTNLPPGLDGRKRFVATVLTAFPDYHAEILEVVAEGDRVVARSGANPSDFDGPGAGRCDSGDPSLAGFENVGVAPRGSAPARARGRASVRRHHAVPANAGAARAEGFPQTGFPHSR